MSRFSLILSILKGRRSISSGELAKRLGISRQAAHKHLKELRLQGKVIKVGGTRGSRYHLAEGSAGLAPAGLAKRYEVSGLQEDRVFEESALLLNLKNELSASSFEITRYSFTELLNNVVDHSKSEYCSVRWTSGLYDIQFHIRDFGIGLFHSIQKKFKLESEYDALGELIKGKTTTMKERHSGEGIFFTSRVADRIFFRSHRILLGFDNLGMDVTVAQKRLLKGTDVQFQLSKQSKRKLEKVFAEYAPAEFEYRFEKTRVRVALFGSDLVSRSTARRMLHGLDKFQEVMLDFENVRSIGQGFADEVFRVFPAAHPGITLRTENVPAVLEPMIRHVRRDNPPNT
jgi:biotin operon repressor